MTDKQTPEVSPNAPSAEEAWSALRGAEDHYFTVLYHFLSNAVTAEDRVSLVKTALWGKTLTDLGFGLRTLRRLRVEERQQCLPELVRLASTFNGEMFEARQLILGLPRDWVLAHIEQAVDAHLARGDEEEYRRFVELYSMLDAGLAVKLVQRAIEHPDPEIREAGFDSLEWLCKHVVEVSQAKQAAMKAVL